jgi:uncharacterized protein
MIQKATQKAIEKIKAKLHELNKTHTDPHAVALGFSIGTFISILPTPGFNILIGIFILLLYPKLNKMSIFIGLAVWNPLTAIPIYIASFKIGSFLFGNTDIVTIEFTIWEKAFHFTQRFLVGNVLLATIIALSSYVLLKKGMSMYRKK